MNARGFAAALACALALAACDKFSTSKTPFKGIDVTGAERPEQQVCRIEWISVSKIGKAGVPDCTQCLFRLIRLKRGSAGTHRQRAWRELENACEFLSQSPWSESHEKT